MTHGSRDLGISESFMCLQFLLIRQTMNFRYAAVAIVIEYIMTVRKTPRACKKNGGGIITITRGEQKKTRRKKMIIDEAKKKG